MIQTLELFTGQEILGHCLGINKYTNILEIKFRCAQTRVAIGTFRLVQVYQQLDGHVKQGEPHKL